MNGKLLQFNKLFDKEETKKFIDWFLRNYGSIRTVTLLDKLKLLGFIHATKSGVSIGLEDLTIPPLKRNLEFHTEKKFNSMERRISMGKMHTLQKVRKLDEAWKIINELIGEEVKKNFKQSDILNPVYMMVFSGARGNFTQVKQLVGMRGFFVNSQGTVLKFPIKSSLKEGLNISEYFTSCYGARKGIIDTALKTADAGYLTRRLVYAGQTQIIKKTNCFSKTGQLTLITKENKEKYNLTEKKIVGRVLAKDVYDPKTKKLIASQGQDICRYVVKKIIQIKRIYVRTPFDCKLNNGLCQLCYGWNVATGELVDLGESVGILAAQSIGEPGTQLTMRTFHTGGVFTSKKSRVVDEEAICSPVDGIASYTTKHGKKLKTRYGEPFFFTLKTKKVVISKDKIIKAVIKFPKHTMLFLKPNQKVYKKQIIAQADNKKKLTGFENDELMAEEKISYTPKTGLIKFETEFETSKKRNKSLRFSNKIKGRRVWLLPGNIVTYTELVYNINIALTCKVYLNFNSDFAKKKKISNQLTRSFFPIRINYRTFNNLSRFNKKYYKNSRKSQNEYKIVKKNIKTSEIFITDNNERWIEIKNTKIKLETKHGLILYKNTPLYDNFINKYTVQVIEVRKNKMCIQNMGRFFITKKNSKKLFNNDFLRPDFKLGSGRLYKGEKSEDIIQGLPKIEQLLEARKTSNLKNLKDNPNEILKNEFITLSRKYTNSTAVRKAFEKVQNIIIERVQKIYKEQQVNIADKHLEVIVRQMTSKVMIIGNGDSNLIVGEIMEVNRIEKINKKLKNKIRYEPVLIGISKISLSNPSFLSQASFQETTRILARSAIEGKIDWLYGLKENLILGNLIPIGTGYNKL
uniref:DNA-directed RNA polymerase n=1 Tax=Colacium vesiculosum TaxID=102910 RepID=J3JR54_9EUGL|nr:RNA polymerase beta'' subunit [Colacium vesiculosum]